VGEAVGAAFAADDELKEATRRLDAWIISTWEPWSKRCREIETGRAFYKLLFDLRSRMEREREMSECVWGFGRLRWRPAIDGGKRVTVDHPLITVPIEITLEKGTGQISLGPSGAPEMENAWTAGLPLSDVAWYNDQRASADQIVLDPWGPEAPGLMRNLLRAIDHDGVLVEDGQIPRVEDHAVADPSEWTLFVRRRQPNFRGFLEDQRRIYMEPGALVPNPFAALVIDEPSSLDSGGGDPSVFGDAGDTPERVGVLGDERLLLPKEANQAQMDIVRLAQSRAGVTAQGPPGTGKSHTIANLISHYVAHGKRVLVTAEKEQALRVLIDKVPEEIRQLCVPVLGADAVARSRLQATMTTIADAAHYRPDRSEITRLESELDAIEARYATTTNILKARREQETGTAPYRPSGSAASEWTPSTAAAWLADNRERLSGVPDAIDQNQVPPLTPTEFAELERFCSSLSQGDAAAALETLPDPATLPAGGYLAGLRAEADELRRYLDDVDERVTDWAIVDAAGPSAIGALLADLEAWGDWHTKMAGSWVALVLADAMDPALAVGWEEFCASATAEREAILAANRTLAAQSVVINVQPLGGLPGPEFMQGLSEARGRIASGRSVGVMQRQARRALDACTVSGRTPSSVAEVDFVYAEVSRRTNRQRLAIRWANLAPRIGNQQLRPDRQVEDQIGDSVQYVRVALDWRKLTWPSIVERLKAIGMVAPPFADAPEVAQTADACRRLLRRARLVEVNCEFEALAERLRSQSGAPSASKAWSQLSDALAISADDRWDLIREEVARLLSLRPHAVRRQELLVRLESIAPLLSAEVAAGANRVTAEDFDQAWAWRQLEVWFTALDDGPEPAVLQAQLEQLAKDRRRVTAGLVAGLAWAAVAEGLNDRRRAALGRFTMANAKLGKGTGRYAQLWETEIRLAMNEAKDAVPVWIMPINKVISSFRPSAEPPFDVIIIDEASQVGLLGAIVLALGKRAIVVGDDQQTSPENVGQDQQEVFDLVDAHLGEVNNRRARFAPTNSLYDISRLQFPQVVQLREHFRCLPPIISFSNHHWYNDTIVPLRDTLPRPGWQALGSVFVPGGTRRRSDDTNHSEAEAVVALVTEMVSDPDYDGMTFGIISLLGSGQGPLIQSLLLDRLGPTMIEDREIRVGDPATFQGDERDVVILSMVVAHDPDSRIGAMNTAGAARRINVAASRARNQMWIVHSVGPESLHRDDPRRALLEHCTTPADLALAAASFEATESQFERDVLTRILDAGYTRVVAQYPVGGFRIDLVVEGPESRLAVECDGDFWHGANRWDDDRARQTVLERAGWTFERIRGSAFYRDRSAALQPLWDRLDSLGIPKGDWVGEIRPTLLHRSWPDDFAPAPELVTAGDGDRPAIPTPTSPEARTLLDGNAGISVVVDAENGHPRLLSGPEPDIPTAREVREWAQGAGLSVGERGRLHPHVISEWNRTHPERRYGE